MRGWETLLEGWQWLGGPSRRLAGAGVPPRGLGGIWTPSEATGEVRRPSLWAGSGKEALLEGWQGLGSHPRGGWQGSGAPPEGLGVIRRPPRGPGVVRGPPIGPCRVERVCQEVDAFSKGGWETLQEGRRLFWRAGRG